MADRDERNTRLAQNAVQRRDLEMQDRLRPALEGERSSQLELGTARNQSDLRNNPFHEQEDAAESQFNTVRAKAAMEDLPDSRRLDSLQRQGAIEDIESGEDKLKRSGINPLAYDFNLRQVVTKNPGLSKKDQQRMARNETLRLQHDAPYVDAIEEEAMTINDPRFRSKFLEDVVDPDTGARFTKVRADAPPDQVQSILRKNTYNKQRATSTREERMAQQAQQHQQASILDKLADSTRAQILALKDDPTNVELPNLKKKLKGFEDRLEQMLAGGGSGGGNMDEMDLAKPGK